MPPLPAQRSDLNRSFLNFPATPGQRTSLEFPSYCWWKVFSFQQTGSKCVEDGRPFQTRTLSLFLMVVLFHFVWTRELDYYSMTGGEQRSAKALRPCAHWMYIWTAPTSLTNLKMALLGWRDDSVIKNTCCSCRTRLAWLLSMSTTQEFPRSQGVKPVFRKGIAMFLQNKAMSLLFQTQTSSLTLHHMGQLGTP